MREVRLVRRARDRDAGGWKNDGPRPRIGGEGFVDRGLKIVDGSEEDALNDVVGGRIHRLKYGRG